MKPQMQQLNRQSGFALIAALFLIVVLAALGLCAMRISSSQQQSTNLVILGTRAQAAAQVGIQAATNRALTPPPPLPNGCIAINNTTINLNQVALKGFIVRVTCIATTYVVNGSAPQCAGNSCTIFEITSTASSGTYGTPDYVSRTASRTVSNVP